jgi:hypothetical protein
MVGRDADGGGDDGHSVPKPSRPDGLYRNHGAAVHAICNANVTHFCTETSFRVILKVQVNVSVEPEHLGAVNGLGQSIAAGMRALGPAVAGVLWSLGSKGLLLQQYTLFAAGAVVSVGAIGVSCWLQGEERPLSGVTQGKAGYGVLHETQLQQVRVDAHTGGTPAPGG